MIIYDPKIAILLIAFNRSNIKQVFDRIKVVKPRRLYIAVDESTNDTQCKICKETTSIVSHIDWECQVFKLYQEKNQGYDKHCFHSISWFFEQEPEGIILEDDCVPSLSFFGYCTTLLKKFRNDERIGHISGSNYQFGKNRGDGTYYYSNLTHVSGGLVGDEFGKSTALTKTSTIFLTNWITYQIYLLTLHFNIAGTGSLI